MEQRIAVLRVDRHHLCPGMGAYLVQKGHIHAVFYSGQDRHLSVQNPQHRCPKA